MTERDDNLLAELLLRWEELHDRGQDTPASELAKDNPDLIEELDRRIRVLKRTAWLDKPIDDDPPVDDHASPTVHSARTLAGRYRLDELIAEGGFAQVFRAYDTELQRTVAVKVPKPGRLQSTEAFQAEARRVARLKHEGIVPVFDVGVEGDSCFIVTEYIEGGSLADRLVKRNIQPDEAIRWATEIGDALEHAHLHGVIHLDIKPANLLLDSRGRARLADFGIARSANKTGQFAPSLGTLRYMSPEQLEGKPSDHRSDIYSLAIVIHEALTGNLPYSSPEANVLRREIVAGNASLASAVPSGVQRVLAKALSKSPHQRHASATEFATALKRAWPTGRLIQPWAWIIGLSLLLAGGTATFMRTAGTRVTEAKNLSLQELLAIAKTDMLHEHYAQAEAGFTQALTIAPGSVEALKGRGFCRLNQKRLEDAVEDFDVALASRPDDATTLRYRSQAHGLLRQFPQAIADLEKVLALSPNATELPGELATIYAIRSHERFQEGDYAGSRADMDEAIRYAPQSAVNYSRRSACWFHVGEYEKAIEDLNEAIARDASNPEFYEKRSYAFEKLGRRSEAEKDKQKAKELAR